MIWAQVVGVQAWPLPKQAIRSASSYNYSCYIYCRALNSIPCGFPSWLMLVILSREDAVEFSKIIALDPRTTALLRPQLR